MHNKNNRRYKVQRKSHNISKNTPLKARNRIELYKMPTRQSLPDEQRVKLAYTAVVANAFNTAAAQGFILFNANSLYDIITSGLVTGQSPYAKGYAENYQRYRVEKSLITVTCASREATDNQYLLLTPTIQSSGVAAASTFAQYSALPFSKNTVIGPITSGQSVAALTQEVDLAKLVGPHYRTQDEYAGTCTGAGVIAAPSTLVYWLFAFYNPDTNTVTTGGLNYQVMMEQIVTFYQPVRDLNADLVEPESTITDEEINQFKIIKKQLQSGMN